MTDAQADLEALRPWLTRVAKGLCRINGVVSWEDLAQEGCIAMWKAHQRFNGHGDLTMWLKANARWRMKTAIKGKTDEQAHDWSVNELEVLLGAEESLAGIEVAYHEGEIMQAINNLTPKQREYVLLRFYAGFQTPQLTEHFGYDPGALWTSKRNGARMKLARQLAHLI